MLPVALAELYENILDFEHLPHLHGWIISAVRVADFGAWGWRGAVTTASGRRWVVELLLDRDRRRWTVRLVDGDCGGTEIRGQATPLGPRQVEVAVDFLLAGVAAAEGRLAGQACGRRFDRWCDEAVGMITERRRQLGRRLDRGREPERTLDLGPRAVLALPREIALGGREFVLVEVDGDLAAFPRQCPHWLGPLGADALDGHVVTCPWHGDRFDVRTGENLSGRPCPLSHLPEITVTRDGQVVLTAVH